MKIPNLPSSYQAGTVKPSSEGQQAANGPFATTSSTVRTMSFTRASDDAAGLCGCAGWALTARASRRNAAARQLMAGRVYSKDVGDRVGSGLIGSNRVDR